MAKINRTNGQINIHWYYDCGFDSISASYVLPEIQNDMANMEAELSFSLVYLQHSM